MKRIDFCKKITRSGTAVLVASSLLVLTGCQTLQAQDSGKVASASVKPVLPVVNNTVPPAAPAAKGPVNACQNELAALAKISPREYAAKKTVFDNLLNSASVYTSVRGQINDQTQEAMDALYKYKVQQVCSDIQYSVMQGLMQRGESLQ